MQVNLQIEGLIRSEIRKATEQLEKNMYRELEKLRKRIVKLELKNSDANKKLKLPGKNEK